MKNIVTLIFLVLPLIGFAQGANTLVQFEAEEIHLGKITFGDKVDAVFKFKNVSDEDVEIDLVSTCECTDANWTKGVIKPGETGEIPFTFDSSKKEDVESVDVDVYFKNVDKNDNPVSVYLVYTFEY